MPPSVASRRHGQTTVGCQSSGMIGQQSEIWVGSKLDCVVPLTSRERLEGNWSMASFVAVSPIL